MARKIMTAVEMNSFSEKVIDMLKGMPLQHALDVLKITERNLLWLCTVKKPEDDVLARQIDIEDVISPRAKQPTRRLSGVA